MISSCFIFNSAFLCLLSGDDWEHEEIFTDDDEAVCNDPEEREDLAPEVPAPPAIKESKPSVKTEVGSNSKSVPSTGQAQSTEPVTEDEIKSVMKQNATITTQALVAKFDARLKTAEEKKSFADILRRISKSQKSSGLALLS